MDYLVCKLCEEKYADKENDTDLPKKMCNTKRPSLFSFLDKLFIILVAENCFLFSYLKCRCG